MSSVVLLTGQAPQHQFVSTVLHEVLGHKLKAVIMESPRRESSRSRIKRAARRYSPDQILSRIHWRVWRHASGAEKRDRVILWKTLFPGGPPKELPGDLLVVVPDHNGPECQGLLRELRPYVLAVYGTDLIRAPVIELAGGPALNLHTGISPQYRGAGSVFWALHNEEPEWIGSTVHILATKVDAGSILTTVRPKIAADDGVASLFAKCVKVGARAYAEQILAVIAGTARATPQDLSIGHQYRFVDRTVKAERRVGKLLKDGLLHRYASGT